MHNGSVGCIVECMGEQPKLREMSIYIWVSFRENEKWLYI